MKTRFMPGLLFAASVLGTGAAVAASPPNVFQTYESMQFVGSDGNQLGGPTFALSPAFPNTIVALVANTAFQNTGAIYNNVVQMCYNPGGQACASYGNNNLAFMLSGPKPGFVLHAAAKVGDLATWSHGERANWDKNFTFEIAPNGSERNIVSGFLTLP